MIEELTWCKGCGELTKLDNGMSAGRDAVTEADG